MVKTVSDLLQKIMERESDILRRQNIRHAPTIGDMYEGLTQNLLSASFPSDLEIEVVGGFITDSAGSLSSQLDCMVVTGPGETIPYTDKRTFNIDDVVAVIEVKKNLYSDDLASGFCNLSSVLGFMGTKGKRIALLQDAFQGITRRPLPSRESLGKLPPEVQLIYHTLVTELHNPARIILGYNGFKSTFALRKSFSDFLSTKLTGGGYAKGYGVPSFPSLICCGKHCLIKATGMPFCAPLLDDGFWPVFASTTGNPVELLLQVIWTRLVYERQLPSDVFDDDEFLQPVTRFIDAKPSTEGDQKGWLYRVVKVSKKSLQQPHIADPWEPIILDEAQFVIMSILCRDESVSILDPDFIRYLAARGYSVDSFVEGLNRTGLAALNGSDLVLLTRSCLCAILPGGRYAAAENASGQFERWMAKLISGSKITDSITEMESSLCNPLLPKTEEQRD